MYIHDIHATGKLVPAIFSIDVLYVDLHVLRINGIEISSKFVCFEEIFVYCNKL